MPKELIQAPPDVVDLIVDQAVLPCLRRIEKDLHVPLSLSVRQGASPEKTARSLGTPSPPEGEVVVGTAQVNVRKNYGGDRFIFRVEVVFPRTLSPETGFSGFSVPGSVTVVDNGYRLESDTWTVQYNVWDFKGWA